MKWFTNIVVLFLLFLIFLDNAHAVYDPLSVANNHYGIHIIDENDLNDAAKLVNSTDGDWGYVKLVIREDDRNIEKWQNILNRLRKLHLIPVVRLATRMDNGGWMKPRAEDIGSWVDFLNSLNWVTENRYIILFNEPNHAQEWGGNINPEEYGWYLKEFSRRLKEKSADFFILPAGLDASAPNSPDTLDETIFIKRMVTKEPDVFDYIDGWTSHSYPNPGFSGSPDAYGKGTVRTYLWELEQFSKYGIDRLPIFITETGWQHSLGKNINRNLLTPQNVANNYVTAFQNVWTDRKIVAVIPFLLNYQDEPFDHFSLKEYQQDSFYPSYEAIQSIVKTKGQPKQKMSAKIISSTIPTEAVAHSQYTFFVDIENTGQSIISSQSGWQLKLTGFSGNFQIKIADIFDTDPFQRYKIEVKLNTVEPAQPFTYNLGLYHKNELVDEIKSQIQIISPPSLVVNAKVWLNKLATGNDCAVLFYDANENLVQERKNIVFENGMSLIENLLNLIPNQKYRIVLTKPYYLPRQEIIYITQKQNQVTFKQLLPFDTSGDGKLDWVDTLEIYKHPFNFIKRIVSL